MMSGTITGQGLEEIEVRARNHGPRIVRADTVEATGSVIGALDAIVQQPIDGLRPGADVVLGKEGPGVSNDVRHFAAAARENGHAAGHGFNQHASELLPPRRRGLTWRAEKGHGVEPVRDLVVDHAVRDVHATSKSARERVDRALLGSAADEKSTPVGARGAQRLDESLDAFLRHEASQKTDDEVAFAPAE